MCLALGDRKLVAAFVLRVACVAFDPDVGELVAGLLLQGLLPEVGVQGREPSDFSSPGASSPGSSPFPAR